MKCSRSVLGMPAPALAGLLVAQLVSADPLPNAWQITDSSTAGNTLLYYTNLLSTGDRIAATNSTGGFHMTVVARMVDDLGGPQTMLMAYGLGNKRFLIWFDLDGSGNLTANLDTLGIYTLTTNGTGSALYHTHEIIYNPTNGTARYVFDGQVISNNWSGTNFALGAGAVHWGAGSSGGRGRMNFNLVTFAVTNHIVASYYAGMAPAPAPDPTNSAPPWTLFKGAGGGTSFTNVSPDLSLLPVATTLPADQLTNNSARLNGESDPNGSTTEAWFEWGTDTNYGTATLPQNLGSGVATVPVSATIGGLMGGPEYHYRLVVSNTFGLAVETDRSFSLSFLLTPIPGLPGVENSSVAWGDYDNDGWLDFLLTGDDGTNNLSQIWRNTGSGFSNVPIPGLPRVKYSSVAWGDFDNDGRLDFLITGYSSTELVSQLWRNMGNGFSNVTASVAAGLPRVIHSSVAWGDFDNDGRLDFMITGATNVGADAISELWPNTGSGFSNVTASVAPRLPGVFSSSVAWGDYDNDGRLDLLVTGLDDCCGRSQIWRNTGSRFINVTASVAAGLPPGVYAGSVAWGDYDNDGRLDFLLTGTFDEATGISQLWRNTGSGFSNVTASVAPGLREVYNSSVAWGDYNNDGRLDFLITGGIDGGLLPDQGKSQLWRNNLPLSNAPPAAPAGLSSAIAGTTVAFNWTAPTDDHTPATGLNYNVRIGTAPGASDVLAPMALIDGWRLLPAMGKAQSTNALFNLSRLSPGHTYYWSVQAVDTSFAGSPFATEASFTLPPRLINFIRYPDGTFEFYFTNLSVLNFDVLVSTNLALPVSNWVNLGPALNLGGGYYRFTAAAAIGQPKRFYLLRKQ